jgi:hypothetical protein
LVWSAAENPLGDIAVDAFLRECMPLVGGTLQGVFSPRAALPEFPMEAVLRVLRECNFDTRKARVELERIGREQAGLWTKAEERHFGAALAKSKKDLRQVRDPTLPPTPCRLCWSCSV